MYITSLGGMGLSGKLGMQLLTSKRRSTEKRWRVLRQYKERKGRTQHTLTHRKTRIISSITRPVRQHINVILSSVQVRAHVSMSIYAEHKRPEAASMH